MSSFRFFSSLRSRLLVSYLAVGAVSIGVLFITVRLTAPSFFDRRLTNMGMQRGAGAMRGAANAADLDQAMAQSLNQGLLIAAGVALLVAVAAALVLSRQVSRQARRLAGASARIAEGDYAERVAVEGPSEFAELATSFNAMAGSLEDVERRRRALVGDVAHELRTPVSVLRGYIEGLADGVFAPGDETWRKLSDETRRLGNLVDELSELSRAENEHLTLDLVTVDPGAAVTLAAERLRPQFETKGLALQVQLPTGLPSVVADVERLTQILANLLNNALNYTPVPGAVTIGCESQGSAVAFFVRDTGIGIATDDLPRVFERFYRADPSRSRASGGSGVGLTIARALAARMQGTLSADSAGPGLGSTFTLKLPASRERPRPRPPVLSRS